MALTQVTNELIATGGVHTNNVADDAVNADKLNVTGNGMLVGDDNGRFEDSFY